MSETIKDLPDAKDLTVEEFLRILVGQCFENDNDTTYLNAELMASDGSISTIEFQIRILSINGVKTREEKDE